jgi:GNAT superfamily N-acetyltransferase
VTEGDRVVVSEEPADGAAASSLLAGFEAEIAALYANWSPSVGPSAEPADFAPPAGCFVVAYQDAVAVGCGGFKRLDERRAEIKRMFVAPAARGRGVARLILGELERLAAARGYSLVRLDTGAAQPHALALYTSERYRAIDDYNGNPYATHWFEKPLHSA